MKEVRTLFNYHSNKNYTNNLPQINLLGIKYFFNFRTNKMHTDNSKNKKKPYYNKFKSLKIL